VQLRRAVAAFEGQRVVYVTVHPAYQSDVPGETLYVVNDATRWDRLGSLSLMARVFWILLKERPAAVISTGAAPGAFAVILGRLLGARTIWLDSIANVDGMSMSGNLARRYSQLWLTQWPHLAREGGPEYAGKVF